LHVASMARKMTNNKRTKTALKRLIIALERDLKSLETKQQNLIRVNEKSLRLYFKLTTAMEDYTAQIMNATREMQEMQMSFNLQYLALQNAIQHENRQFSMISNIMKTKHDTVKNSIENIR